MLTPEGKLKQFVKGHLKALGAYFFMAVQTGYGATTLDFLCCVSGRFLAIETKAPGKEPTTRQYLIMEQVKEAGGAAFWCDSKEAFLSAMTKHGFNELRSSCVPAIATKG